MTVKETKKAIVGRKIVRAEANAFRSGRDDYAWAYNWKLFLDNGDFIYFTTQETEVGDYGTELCVSRNGKQLTKEEA